MGAWSFSSAPAPAWSGRDVCLLCRVMDAVRTGSAVQGRARQVQGHHPGAHQEGPQEHLLKRLTAATATAAPAAPAARSSQAPCAVAWWVSGKTLDDVKPVVVAGGAGGPGSSAIETGGVELLHNHPDSRLVLHSRPSSTCFQQTQQSGLGRSHSRLSKGEHATAP
jgi:hypothetical protein